MAEKLPEPLVKALSDEIEKIRIDEGIEITKGNSELLSKLRDRITIPEGFRISSLNDFFRKRKKNPNAVLKFVPQGTDKGNVVRQVLSDRPGGELYSRKGGVPYLRRQGKTKEFLNFIDNLGYDEDLISKYFWEIDRDIRKILTEIKDINIKLPKGSDQKVSYGHLHRLSKSIDSPRNLFVELLTENVDKGNRYSLNPAGQLATGNPIKEGATWLENWKNDFLIWADRVENGGTGILPQRGQYSNLLEQKFRELTGTQWDKLDDVGKASAIDDINDLIHDTEKLNQFTVKQSDELRKWGLLNPDQAELAINWVNDPDIRKLANKPTVEVTEVGKRLGGIGNTISTKAIKNQPKLLSMGDDIATWRNIAKGSTVAGLMGISVLGTGASAVETDARVKIAKKTNNWMDKTQAGISGFSLANDLGSYTGIWALPGGVLSTGADLLNMTIDSVRTPQTKEESEKEIKDQTESDMYDFTTL